MDRLIPVAIAYENGRTSIRAGMMVTGATSMAHGQVAERRGDVLFLSGVTGAFVRGERLVCSSGGHGVVGELSLLDQLASEL